MVTACLILYATTSARAVDWQESIDGDLSNDHETPTAIDLGIGSSSVSGRMGAAEASLDPDFWTITIGDDERLTGFTLDRYQPASYPGEVSFIAMALGTSISVHNPTDHITNGLIGAADLGNSLLSRLATPLYGGSGLPDPLGPGTYTLWWQETAAEVDYRFSFVVSVIPEPTVAMLGGSGLLFLRRTRA